MKKSINPRAIEIQRRFFEALELLIASKQLSGLKEFCDNHQLNRTKYSRIKTGITKSEDNLYKMIDIDALAAICSDYGVSSNWLLLGRGKMLKSKEK